MLQSSNKKVSRSTARHTVLKLDEEDRIHQVMDAVDIDINSVLAAIELISSVWKLFCVLFSSCFFLFCFLFFFGRSLVHNLSIICLFVMSSLPVPYFVNSIG